MEVLGPPRTCRPGRGTNPKKNEDKARHTTQHAGKVSTETMGGAQAPQIAQQLPGGMAQAVAGACTSYNGGANTGATRWMGCKEDPNVVDKLPKQVAQMQAR